MKRWFLVAIAVVAAASFAISVWAGRWWQIGEVEVGPFGSHHCFNGDCRPGGLAWTNGGDFWMRTAVATWVGSLLTMVLLLGVAGAIAAKRVPKMLAKSVLTSLVTTAAAGTYFIVKLPAMTTTVVGQGLYVFVAACVLGAVAPIWALTQK